MDFVFVPIDFYYKLCLSSSYHREQRLTSWNEDVTGKNRTGDTIPLCSRHFLHPVTFPTWISRVTASDAMKDSRRRL